MCNVSRRSLSSARIFGVVTPQQYREIKETFADKPSAMIVRGEGGVVTYVEGDRVKEMTGLTLGTVETVVDQNLGLVVPFAEYRKNPSSYPFAVVRMPAAQPV